MVEELSYKAETFDICVDGKTYPVSASKLFLVEKMRELCIELSEQEKPKIVVFMEKIYDVLKKILGEEIYSQIFADKEYDVEFMSAFCCYLSKMAKPQMQSVVDRLSKITQKYSVDNLNEPVDTQTAENG